MHETGWLYVRVLSAAEAAYAAGIVDGEGCVTISATRATYHALVAVASTDKVLTDWLLAHVGAGSVSAHRPLHPLRLTQFRYYLCGPEAAEFLRQVSEFLVIKRGQANVLMQFERERVSLRVGRAYSDEARERLGTLKNEIHAMHTAKGRRSPA
jgi:hypothetical protein